MPRKRPSLRLDENEIAYRTVQASIGEGPRPEPPGKRTTKNPEAVKRGRKGGKVGGKSRSAKLTPEHRSELASEAARARWAKGKKN